MNIEILYRPSYSLGVIKLEPEEEVMVESGAMVGMSQGVTLQTKATGGLFKSLSRSLFGGESFFQNSYKASETGGEVCVAPTLPGDVLSVDLRDEKLMIQSGSYLASELGVVLDTKWSGARTFFASEGAIMLCASGSGKLLISSYGAIHEKNLQEGEEYTVDSGHLVAFSADMGFGVRTIGGIKSTFFSGEGLVVDLVGPGRILMQTRSTESFLSWLMSKIPRGKESQSGS